MYLETNKQAKVPAMLSGKNYIYGLTDPRDLSIRYVGRTGGGLLKRVGKHMAAAKRSKDTPLLMWLSELIDLETKPLPILLATVEETDWRQEERNWIAHIQRLGSPLLNGNEGGTGPTGGHSWSAENIEKMRLARVGRARGGTSRYPGVCKHKATGRWIAQLCGTYVGLGDSEEEAFEQYRSAFRVRFGIDVPGCAGLMEPNVGEELMA